MSVTASFFAGDTDKLWKTFDVLGNHTGTPSNGESIDVWQDEATPGARNLAFHTTNAGNPLVYGSPGSMRLPSIAFNGASDAMQLGNNMSSYGGVLTNLVSDNAKTIISALRFTSGGTNHANIYDNSAVFADTPNGYFGIHFKTVSNTHSLIAYNWDTNVDLCSIDIALNTDYVIMVRHNGTTLSLSVLSGNGGETRSDTSVSSGNTSVMTGQPRIGINRGNAYCPVIIGELYFDNTDMGSTNSQLTDVIGRWLPPASSNGNNIVTSVRQKRGTRSIIRGMRA